MNIEKLTRFISKPRIDRYLTAVGESSEKAIKLYQINLRVSQAFYPFLHLFEIFFRNAINHELTVHFNNPNWILDEKSGFMSDSSLAQSRYFLSKSVQKAEQLIAIKGGAPTAGRVIAEQSFGVWSSFFEPQHFKLVNGSVLHSFPYKPAHVNRRAISEKVKRIRKFRNRIYHNEPICFQGNEAGFSDALNIRKEIIEMLQWMDPDLDKYAADFDNIVEETDKIQSL